MSRISYGLHHHIKFRKDQKQETAAHLSLKALRIRSTSSSRWKADASRESSCSISVSTADVGVFELEGADIPVDIGRGRSDKE